MSMAAREKPVKVNFKSRFCVVWQCVSPGFPDNTTAHVINLISLIIATLEIQETLKFWLENWWIWS